MAEITGVLSTTNALVPQDIEITPSNEDITITADEGVYIRSVIVRAIPSDEPQEENDNGNTGEEGTQEP